jgi:hypothetical protein
MLTIITLEQYKMQLFKEIQIQLIRLLKNNK